MSDLQDAIVYRKVRGIVSWFNFVKRFGFIMSDVGDIFVHKSNLSNRSTLRTGQLVEFDVRNAPRGLQALNVCVVTDDSSGRAQDDSDSDSLATGVVIAGYDVSPHRNRPSPARSRPREPPAQRRPPPPPPTYKQESRPVEVDNSGFDTSRFEGDIPDELICSICQGVLNDPVQTACEHLFCRHCIEEWLDHQRVCPLDREPLHHKPISGVPRYLKRMLGALKIRCTFADKGCNKVVTLDELDSHLRLCSHAKPKTPVKTPLAFPPRSNAPSPWDTCSELRPWDTCSDHQPNRRTSFESSLRRTQIPRPPPTPPPTITREERARRRRNPLVYAHLTDFEFDWDEPPPYHDAGRRTPLYPSLDDLTDGFHYTESLDDSPNPVIQARQQTTRRQVIRQDDSCSVM